MQILVLFGLPGAGKTYTGKILQKNFGFHLYDADCDLPRDMDYAIQNQLPITDSMRDKFFKKIILKTYKLKTRYEKIAITQTFLKEKYRQQFLDEFPEAKFILIKTKTQIRENRLAARKEYPLDLVYTQKMAKIFDDPKIKYISLINNPGGKESIKQQLKKLLPVVAREINP